MLRTNGNLNAGEIAGFDEEEAKNLIQKGIAEPYEPAPKLEPQPEPAPYQTEAAEAPPADRMMKPKKGRR